MALMMLFPSAMLFYYWVRASVRRLYARVTGKTAPVLAKPCCPEHAFGKSFK